MTSADTTASYVLPPRLRVLLVEDSELDAELVAERLAADGIVCDATRVEDRAGFCAALEACAPDVILSDFSLPAYDGPAALADARARCPDVPFLFVSGAIGEERAIEMLKAGATDYVLKHRLERLAPAVRRALRERDDRRARARAEASLRFLTEASTRLASSLEYEATLQHVTQLAVPSLADWCMVIMREPDGPPPALVAVSHVDPARAALVREHYARLERCVAPASFSSANAVRDARARLNREVRPEELRVLFPDPGAYEVMQRVGLASVITAPLARQGRAFGALVLATASAARRLDHDDLALAEELARRASVAIENARLFEAAQHERQRAERANRAKDEFLAAVSHEVRTPLNAIVGWTRMLRTGQLTEDKRQRALETIERNAQVQVHLIEDLLDISRIVTGKLRLEVAPADLVQVVEAAVDAVRPAAEAKGIQLEPTLDVASAPVEGDANRLQQVVWNLLSNAVKFTPRGGRVQARLRRDADAVEIAVSDTGQGIAHEFLPHVFDRFRQEDGSITRAHGGLGLGLAITRHLVELHGGHIEATSEGSGRGATFSVRIPVSALRATSAPPPVTSAVVPAQADGARPRAALEGLRVLVVDDEPDARELVRSVLEYCRAQVTVAASVPDALEALRASRFDVLVSDIGMPAEDGYSLIQKVRLLPDGAGGRTPAVALTAYARIEDRARALVAGFNAHVTKPVEPTELVATIADQAGRAAAPPAL